MYKRTNQIFIQHHSTISYSVEKSLSKLKSFQFSNQYNMQPISLLVLLFIGNAIGAPSTGVVFESTENDSTLNEQVQTPQISFKEDEIEMETKSEKTVPVIQNSEDEKTVSFPVETETVDSEVEGPKAPEGIVPAEIDGVQDGRTFHHLAKLHYKIDQKVGYLLYKILGSFLPPPGYIEEPHYFQQSPYYYNYDDDKHHRTDLYSSNSNTKSSIAQALKPLTKIPQYLVNHPINFKQTFEKLHHSIGKRSVEDNNNALTQGDDFSSVPRYISNSRQPKTLYKIIPNFEQNFGAVMKRVFGPLYGSNVNNNQIYAENPYKSSLPGRPTISYTTFMQLLPQILQRMSNLIRTPIISST